MRAARTTKPKITAAAEHAPWKPTNKKRSQVMKNDPYINWLKKWRVRLEQTGFFLLFMIDLVLIGFVGLITVSHLIQLVYEIQTPHIAVSFANPSTQPPNVNTKQMLRAKYHLHRGAVQGPTQPDSFTVGDDIARYDKLRLTSV